MELDRKAKPRYLGPYVIVRKTLGGAYLIAEIDGSILKTKIAAFRLIPYHPRKAIEIPVSKLTDLSTQDLDDIEQHADEVIPADHEPDDNKDDEEPGNDD